MFAAAASAPLTDVGIAVADIDPACAVIGNHAADFTEYVDEPRDELRRRFFEADLAINAVVPQSKVRRRRHAHLHGSIRKALHSCDAVTQQNPSTVNFEIDHK